MSRIGSRWPLLLLTTLLLTGCDDQPSMPAMMKTGGELYNYYCRNCHKLRGPGELMETRDRSQPPLKQHEIMLLIEYGSPLRHLDQPKFPELSPEQIDLIASHVSKLQRDAEQPAQ
ncbi:c-type cytochrome [Marinobacterium arenosum]|uniref:c-type cytochrome n=1 Tax=Marinobacterium arenosum TaxID=2862496 RepID=UPI001C95FE9A|nr:cytochrome c [Marinobacterium arenosum]MBY4676217.1 cytochrome c [Marinobacterium arenosum]